MWCFSSLRRCRRMSPRRHRWPSGRCPTRLPTGRSSKEPPTSIATCPLVVSVSRALPPLLHLGYDTEPGPRHTTRQAHERPGAANTCSSRLSRRWSGVCLPFDPARPARARRGPLPVRLGAPGGARDRGPDAPPGRRGRRQAHRRPPPRDGTEQSAAGLPARAGRRGLSRRWRSPALAARPATAGAISKGEPAPWSAPGSRRELVGEGCLGGADSVTRRYRSRPPRLRRPLGLELSSGQWTWGDLNPRLLACHASALPG